MLIASQKNGQKGFTLIEMMVAVVILGLLAAVAFPSFETMLKNSRVRNGAEAISNGLQRARAEAVARNTQVAFVLLDTDGASWQVAIAGGEQIEKRESSEGSKSVTVTTSPANTSVVTFNNVGSVVANNDGSATVTKFKVSEDGASTSLQINVGLGGTVKMCDTSLAAGSSPRACE